MNDFVFSLFLLEGKSCLWFRCVLWFDEVEYFLFKKLVIGNVFCISECDKSLMPYSIDMGRSANICKSTYTYN